MAIRMLSEPPDVTVPQISSGVEPAPSMSADGGPMLTVRPSHVSSSGRRAYNVPLGGTGYCGHISLGSGLIGSGLYGCVAWTHSERGAGP